MILSNKDTDMFIIYNNKKCPFIPIKYNSKSNEVDGQIIFIENGAYNPCGWYINIRVNKKDIIS